MFDKAKIVVVAIFCIGLVAPVLIVADRFLPAAEPHDGPSSPAASADLRLPALGVRTTDSIIASMLADGQIRKGYREWYVSAAAKDGGNGTSAAPFDLATALLGGNGEAAVRPGDVVWIRGGNYVGSFDVRAGGDPRRPVHFRQYPGERAVIDKAANGRETGALNVRSPGVWFWDLEIANSDADRAEFNDDGKADPRRGSGVNVYASGTKYINLIVRDNGHGFGLWNEDGDTEINGCLIFNNGDNKREHGIYAHNRDGTQLIADNFIFNNAGYGIHIYANSEKSAISGFNVIGNTVFGNGAISGPDQATDQILAGGVEGAPADRIFVTENFVFAPRDGTSSKGRGVRLGYRDANNGSAEIRDNLIVAKVPLKILWWKSVAMTGNTIAGPGTLIDLQSPPDGTTVGNLSGNRYFSGNGRARFAIGGKTTDLAGWRSAIRSDTDAEIVAGISSPMISLRPNRFDAGRANLTVYDPRGSGTVAVDLSRFLKRGDRFEIRDVQDFFGTPAASGIFDGGPVNLPMNDTAITLPVGSTARLPVRAGPEFGAFVIFRSNSNSP